MDFLALFQESVVLSDTLKCEFFHQINFVGLDHVFVLWERRHIE
jgi:hypothetical protein